MGLRLGAGLRVGYADQAASHILARLAGASPAIALGGKVEPSGCHYERTRHLPDDGGRTGSVGSAK